MQGENDFIKVEFRFSENEELATIQNELSLSGVVNYSTYDGMIEATVPISVLGILKKKNILMDFPMRKQILKDEKPELYNINSEVSQVENDIIRQEIADHFKENAKKGFINQESNQFFEKEQAAEVSSQPENGETGPEIFPATEITKDLESLSLPSEVEAEPVVSDDLYLISFNGPFNNQDRVSLKENNILLTNYHDDNTEYCYKSFLSAIQYQFLSGLQLTLSIKKFPFDKKITSSIVQEFSEAKENVAISKIIDIELLDKKFIEKVTIILESSTQAKILETGETNIRIETNPASPLLASIAALPYVISVSIYAPPSLFCNVCRKTIGLDFPEPSTAYFGKEEIIGIIDSGIDENHKDLKKNIKAVLQYGSGLAKDAVGHGTHVAGIICGDGTASNGKIKGIAPCAKIVSLGVLDNNKKMDLPADIGIVLKLAADNGAKIINLSWGFKLSGEYQNGSYSIDKFIYENPEILVVVAAGNEGNAKAGVLSYKTVGVPGTAKNVLTVGAATSRRTDPVINETWGTRSPANFPTPPQNTEMLVSPEELPAVISSRGPTDYDSIKPEVLAPGNYILSAKANGIDLAKTNPEYFDEHYTFKTGTSMAAPVVTGIAALIREYIRIEHKNKNPSSSLLKAIIIGSSHQIENSRKPPADNSLNEVGFPDFDQGFGFVNMEALFITKKNSLAFADVSNSDTKALVSRSPIGGIVKSYREYIFDIGNNAADLSVTLCWIDFPAKGVQNNLQLSLKTPSNEWEIGNMNHFYKKSSVFDTTNTFNLKPHDKYNTTEKILIKNPKAGKYLIKITAQNTINLPQGYSLAVLGETSGFIER